MSQNHSRNGEKSEKPQIASIKLADGGRLLYEVGNPDAFVQASEPDWYNQSEVC